METGDCVIAWLAYLVALLQRLWMVHYPSCPVFDEVHFGEFVNSYTNRTFFLDIHPPLGKLMYFAIARLARYPGSICFDDEEYSVGDEFYVSLRVLNCLVSALCSPLVYLTLRAMKVSVRSSMCAAIMFMSETSYLVQHRFILIDGFLHAFVLFHVFTLVSGFSPLVVGVSLGLAISCKYTALGLIPLQFVVNHRSTGQVFVALLVVWSFTIVHLMILTESSFDAKELLSRDVYECLFTNRSAINVIRAGIAMQFDMHRINMANRIFHPYQSRPESWPMFTGIWVRIRDDEAEHREINCMGNVFVLVPTFLAICVGVFLMVKDQNARVSVIGWVLSYFPFFFVQRSMFFYHYQVPLLFAILSWGIVMEKVPYPGRVVNVICGMLGLCYWSPFVYGGKVANRLGKIWIPQWADGGQRHSFLVREFFGLVLQ